MYQSNYIYWRPRSSRSQIYPDFAEAKPSSTPAQTAAGEFELLAMEVLKIGIN